MVNNRWHSARARELIAACGGLEEAAANCRVSKSVLSDAQCVHKPSALAGDVIADLEAYCGEALYSTQIAELGHAPAPSIDLTGDVLALGVSTAKMAHDLYIALEDGRIDAAERAHLLAKAAPMFTTLRQIESALTADPVVHLSEVG